MFLLFLIGCLYALLHFIWESILAPSIRLNTRLELFALRDRLRRLKISNPDISDEAFHVVQDGLNSAIKYLYDIDVQVLIQCDWMAKHDPEVRARVEKRHAAVKAANSDDLLEISRKLRRHVESCAVINNGGWLLYIIPIAVVVFLFGKVCAPIVGFVYMPNHELQKLIPQRDPNLCPA